MASNPAEDLILFEAPLIKSEIKKKKSGLIGNNYSTQQVFDEYIKITINE